MYSAYNYSKMTEILLIGNCNTNIGLDKSGYQVNSFLIPQ